jgi:DNA-directed RNA polymerase subunit N (RpoN/RPB10)
MKIFNIKQADIFIKHGCIVCGCGLGNKYKTYIEFVENEKLHEMMKRWMAKEF